MTNNKLREAVINYLDAEKGFGAPSTGGFGYRAGTYQWTERMHRASKTLAEALEEDDPVDYQAIARLQSRKLQLALERVSQLQDALRKALMDMPGAFLHRHVTRAQLLCAPLTFDNVPHAGLHLTVTLTTKGEAVMVSWQDDEHRIVNVVWQRGERTAPADAAR